MEDEQEFTMKTTFISTGEEVDETNTPIAAGEPSVTEAGFGFVVAPVKVEVEIDDEDSATDDFQEILLRQEIIEDEVGVRDGSVDGDMTEEVQMEVDHAQVMENDLDVAAVPLFNGDETPPMTARITIPNSQAQVENSSAIEDDEISSEETVSSSSFASPHGFFEKKEKSVNPNGRISSPSDFKCGPENGLQVNELEEQVKALQNLLILKEKEWNVILRLKKHTECVLEQVKYGQRLTKARTSFDEKMPMTEDDKNTWMRLITSNNIGTLKKAEQKVKQNTEKHESRYITMEKAFALGSLTSTPRSSLQGLDSIGLGEKNNMVAANSDKTKDSEKKFTVKQKPTLKPAPKLPASKSLASSPATAASQDQQMNKGAAADLQPFIRTLRDIAANKNKVKTNTAFKPFRMTTADRRFRYQKVIEKLKVEANKLRKAAKSSGNTPRPAVKQSATSTSSRQQTQQSASSERSVVVTFSTGEKNLVSQQNYRQESAVPVPMCQGCHAAPSEYMCSICKDQWYCSRNCQLKDWAEHSDFCSSS